MIKLILIIVFAFAALFGTAVAVQHYLSIDDLTACSGPDSLRPACAPADAVVAISGGDTQARAAEAIALYKAGWAPKIIFSGAALDATGPSNADAMRRQALNANVPDSAIVLDGNAVDTAQNARNASDLLTDADRIVLVTSPYHQRRAYLEFKKFFGDRVTIVNHPTPNDRNWPPLWWTTATGWWLAFTETLKTLVVSYV